MQIVLTQYDIPPLLSLLLLFCLSSFHLSHSITNTNNRIHLFLGLGWLCHIFYVILEWSILNESQIYRSVPPVFDVLLLLFFVGTTLKIRNTFTLKRLFLLWSLGAFPAWVALSFGMKSSAGISMISGVAIASLFSSVVYLTLSHSLFKLCLSEDFSVFISQIKMRDGLGYTEKVPPSCLDNSTLFDHRELQVYRKHLARVKTGLVLAAAAFWIFGALNLLYFIAVGFFGGLFDLATSIFYIGLVVKFLTGLGFAVALHADMKLTEMQLYRAKSTEHLAIITSGVEHQLRGPLYKLTLLRSTLRREIAEYGYRKLDRYVTDLGNIHANFHSVCDLIVAMRESVEKQRHPETAVVNRAVDQAVELSKTRDSGVAVHFSVVGRHLSLIAEAKEERLVQVLSIILNNAIEASLQKNPNKIPRVKIALSSDKRKERINVSVTDHGVGIPEDAIPYIFQPYSTSKGHQPEGINRGLGLFLANRLVRLYGGEISVSSQETEGTTFMILLQEYSKNSYTSV